MNTAKRTQPLSPDELRLTFEDAVGGRARATPPPKSASSIADVHHATGLTPVDVPALMGLNDRAFVETAYASLLGRKPDDAGLRYHLASLAAGQSRILTLGALRYSPEGRRMAAPVPGLRKRFLLHRLYRLRGIGRLLRTLTAIAALPGLLRDVSRLSVDVNELRAKSRDIEQRAERAMLGVAERAAEHALERAHATMRDLDQRLEKVTLQAAAEPWADPVLALAERVDIQATRLAQLEASKADSRVIAELGGAIGALRRQQGWPEDDTSARLVTLLQDHRNLAIRALGTAERSQALVRDQERRLSLILGDVRRMVAHGADAGVTARLDDARAELLDPLYVAFEDRFRGSRADIKQRQRVYLELLIAAGAGTPERPILDVGSGRGELLELLGEAGLQARGVDLNQTMVTICADAGLDSIHDDAVAYLSRVKPGTLGAVTGFHIVEHLSFPLMVALLDASLHALAPGGLVIFETPNPANLLVASRWFYLDPTHRNPLPSEMVAMIAEARGFIDVTIRELHPMQSRFEAQDEVLAGQLNAIFYGPQDYSLIARKA